MTIPTFPLQSFTKVIFFSGWFLLIYTTFNLIDEKKSVKADLIIIDSIKSVLYIDSLKSINPKIKYDSGEFYNNRYESLKSLNAMTARTKHSSGLQTETVIFALLGVFMVLITKGKIDRNEKLQESLLEYQHKMAMLDYEEKLNALKPTRKYIRIK